MTAPEDFNLPVEELGPPGEPEWIFYSLLASVVGVIVLALVVHTIREGQKRDRKHVVWWKPEEILTVGMILIVVIHVVIALFR